MSRPGVGWAALGLAPGEKVTEAQLWNLFGERGWHPYVDRIEADRLAKGDSPKKAFKASALGRRVTVTGVDLVFWPQPSIYLLRALGDEETRRMIEATHERVLEWNEDEVAVIRYGKNGIDRVRPPGGLVAARLEAAAPTPPEEGADTVPTPCIRQQHQQPSELVFLQGGFGDAVTRPAPQGAVRMLWVPMRRQITCGVPSLN
ncbi:relaxase domain-containing protein [Streptomyces sp. NPDC014685]|uniref:relaxase domain-containing protein n=1 Tax=Streptomyces sp. NPDC014685 TaxID=3364881 RepID=UPI0036F7E21D